MTELQIAGVLFYILIGWFLADTILMDVDLTYWLFILFYPIFIIGFILLLLILWGTVLLYKIAGVT